MWDSTVKFIGLQLARRDDESFRNLLPLHRTGEMTTRPGHSKGAARIKFTRNVRLSGL